MWKLKRKTDPGWSGLHTFPICPFKNEKTFPPFVQRSEFAIYVDCAQGVREELQRVPVTTCSSIKIPWRYSWRRSNPRWRWSDPHAITTTISSSPSPPPSHHHHHHHHPINSSPQLSLASGSRIASSPSSSINVFLWTKTSWNMNHSEECYTRRDCRIGFAPWSLPRGPNSP